jgi:DNA-binding MarR family transcriptional regulator
MSRENVDELRAQVGRQSQALQAAVDDVDQAAATALGVNRTDLRCLEVLIRGESTPSALAAELGLTSGSVTTMLDRLTELGHVTRAPQPGDRRKVLVRMTPETIAKTWEIYGPIAQEGAADLTAYTGDQLHTILDFLTRSRALQQRHRERISSMPKTTRATNP